MTNVLDGNAAAGALGEVFVAEMTAALTICARCGDKRPIGELNAYVDGPGIVLRCASCDAVQVRFVRGPHRAWLHMGGVSVVEFGNLE